VAVTNWHNPTGEHWTTLFCCKKAKNPFVPSLGRGDFSAKIEHI